MSRAMKTCNRVAHVRAIPALFCVLLMGALQPAAAASRQDRDLVARVERADQAYTEGRLLDAEQLYRQVLRAHPRSTHALLRLGNIQLRNSELEAAALSYRECIKYAPEDARCWNNLALTHVKMAADTLEQSRQFVSDPEQQAPLESFRRRIIESTAVEITEVR